MRSGGWLGAELLDEPRCRIADLRTFALPVRETLGFVAERFMACRRFGIVKTDTLDAAGRVLSDNKDPRPDIDSTRMGLEVAVALQTLYPGKIDFALSKRLIGSDDVVRRLQAGEDPRLIQQSFQEQVEAFLQTREKYLIYK